MTGTADLNAAASANRLHISFFGCRNAGKSSLVNRLTGQDLSVVSSVKGTTTDPVSKAMELLPLGPVVIIDTPGFDDEGMLGEKRVKKARQVLNRTDLAVLVMDASAPFREEDGLLLSLFREKQIPHLILLNKMDLVDEDHHASILMRFRAETGESTTVPMPVSAATGEGIEEVKDALGRLIPPEDPAHTLTNGIVNAGDLVILVIPIDKAAPKGRLIMPQQMAIRSILDTGARTLVTRDVELADSLAALKTPPSLVITDSQVFGAVSRIVPEEVPLTSFSILMAKYKGTLKSSLEGVAALEHLKDGDRILMAEGCTHHRQCGDIGTVKIPGWLRKYSGKELIFETCSGREYPEDLTPYAAVIHCGGCMTTDREMLYRMKCAGDQGIPFTNYGIVIARMTGILARSIRVFPELSHFS